MLSFINHHTFHYPKLVPCQPHDYSYLGLSIIGSAASWRIKNRLNTNVSVHSCSVRHVRRGARLDRARLGMMTMSGADDAAARPGSFSELHGALTDKGPIDQSTIKWIYINQTTHTPGCWSDGDRVFYRPIEEAQHIYRYTYNIDHTHTHTSCINPRNRSIWVHAS